MNTTSILRFPSKQGRAEEIVETLRKELAENPNACELLCILKDDAEGIYSVYTTPTERTIDTIGAVELLKAHLLEGLLR